MSHTYNCFKQIENQPEERKELLKPLPSTIRYKQFLPPVDFQTLCNCLESFWEYATSITVQENSYYESVTMDDHSDTDTIQSESSTMSQDDQQVFGEMMTRMKMIITSQLTLRSR